MATHKPGHEVFEICRCKPSGLAEPKRWLRREKGCDVSVVVVGSTRSTAQGESDNDPNCTLCDRRVGLGPLGLHKPVRSRPTGAWWGHIGSGFWCCDWSSGGWRAGSRSRSSDRRGNRNIWGSRYYTSIPTGHLLCLPSLRTSWLRISGLRAAGLWLPRLLGISRLLRSSGLGIPSLLGTARLPRLSGRWIPRLLGTARL